MVCHSLPDTAGTDVLNDTADFIASYQMPDRDQQQALKDLARGFVGQTYQPTSNLDKHSSDTV